MLDGEYSLLKSMLFIIVPTIQLLRRKSKAFTFLFYSDIAGISTRKKSWRAPTQEESLSMTYSRRNMAEEQKEASQKAKQIATLCEQLSITVGPIDWQHAGMRACVTVNAIE